MKLGSRQFRRVEVEFRHDKIDFLKFENQFHRDRIAFRRGKIEFRYVEIEFYLVEMQFYYLFIEKRRGFFVHEPEEIAVFRLYILRRKFIGLEIAFQNSF